jgi:gamma-glutamyltranspeptidase/glutathione hydrolase
MKKMETTMAIPRQQRQRRFRAVISIWVLLLATCLTGVHVKKLSASEVPAPPAGAKYASRSGDFPAATRSVVMARNGMVATSHPLATLAGLNILQAGGNAADAAIAACAVNGVVEPMSCGIGGDLFVIYWHAKTQTLYGLNASGRSPYTLNRDVFASKGLTEIPTHGPLSWSVPGCVDGWNELKTRFGSREWPELLAEAIHHADAGFPVTEVIAGYWKGSERGLARYSDSARVYLPGGRAPRVGEVFQNPELAETLRKIAADGRNAFYTGDIARQIVEFSKSNGGYFELRDFADHRSNWVDPVSTNYRGFDVWQLPPNGQGIAVLQMLNVLEQAPVGEWGPNDPRYWHLFVEAKKLAYADRARYYADPDFAPAPVAELISKPYAARQFARISMDKALRDVPPGDPKSAHADTIYLTVVDKDRNCCSLIQSNFHGFGSLMTAGRTGFALQNRGNLFSLDPKHANSLQPHKRPFQTIIPAFVTRNGSPWFCFGVMGGDMQPQGQVQVLVNLIDFGMNVQQAGDMPRLQHSGSATPTGQPGDADGGLVALEPGYPPGIAEKLRSLGHRVQIVGAKGFGGYQGILIDSEAGVLHGATESRKDGCAIGY